MIFLWSIFFERFNSFVLLVILGIDLMAAAVAGIPAVAPVAVSAD